MLDIITYRNIKSPNLMARFSNIIGDMTGTSAVYYE